MNEENDYIDILREANEISIKDNLDNITDEHILYAILKNGKSKAISLLEDFNVNTDMMLLTVNDYLELEEESFVINITEEVKKNKVHEFIGREEYIDKIIRILFKKQKNNCMLIGPAGVGKTALVEGVAKKLIEYGYAENPPGNAGGFHAKNPSRRHDGAVFAADDTGDDFHGQYTDFQFGSNFFAGCSAAAVQKISFFQAAFMDVADSFHCYRSDLPDRLALSGPDGLHTAFCDDCHLDLAGWLCSGNDLWPLQPVRHQCWGVQFADFRDGFIIGGNLCPA